MRKCEETIREAVLSGNSVSTQNTMVAHFGNGDYVVYLHGNAIARGRTGSLPSEFCLAGWNTVTTRSRLHSLGISVTTIQFVPHYNGEAISEWEWYKVESPAAHA